MAGVFNSSIFNNSIFNTGDVAPTTPGGDIHGRRRRRRAEARKERDERDMKDILSFVENNDRFDGDGDFIVRRKLN